MGRLAGLLGGGEGLGLQESNGGGGGGGRRRRYGQRGAQKVARAKLGDGEWSCWSWEFAEDLGGLGGSFYSKPESVPRRPSDKIVDGSLWKTAHAHRSGGRVKQGK